MLLLSFNPPPYSSPITQNPVRFAILYRVTKHYRKRHGFTPSRKKTALFGVLFKFPHRVQMWCAENEFYEEDENCCLYLWRMDDDCESLKNQKHCVWEWRNKTKNFQYWKKKKGFENNSTKSHFKTWPKLNLYVDSIDFQTLRKT